MYQSIIQKLEELGIDLTSYNIQWTQRTSPKFPDEPVSILLLQERASYPKKQDTLIAIHNPTKYTIYYCKEINKLVIMERGQDVPVFISSAFMFY